MRRWRASSDCCRSRKRLNAPEAALGRENRLRRQLAFTIASERTEFDPGDVLFVLIGRPTRFEVLSEEAAEYFVSTEKLESWVQC